MLLEARIAKLTSEIIAGRKLSRPVRLYGFSSYPDLGIEPQTLSSRPQLASFCSSESRRFLALREKTGGGNNMRRLLFVALTKRVPKEECKGCNGREGDASESSHSRCFSIVFIRLYRRRHCSLLMPVESIYYVAFQMSPPRSSNAFALR